MDLSTPGPDDRMKLLPPAPEPEQFGPAGPAWIVFEVRRQGLNLQLVEVARVRAGHHDAAIFSAAESLSPPRAATFAAILEENLSTRDIQVNYFITME